MPDDNVVTFTTKNAVEEKRSAEQKIIDKNRMLQRLNTVKELVMEGRVDALAFAIVYDKGEWTTNSYAINSLPITLIGEIRTLETRLLKNEVEIG